MKKGFGLISIIISLAVFGVLVYGSVYMMKKAVPPGENSDAITAPIDAAKEAKRLIEQHTGTVTGSADSIVVYDGISVPENATELNLSGRGLSGSLKAEIRHLQDLTILDVSDNNFTGLPAEVGQLIKLENLNLSNNQFTGLPQELGNLQNLKLLDLRGNEISTFDFNFIRAALPSSTVILTN